MTKEAVGGWIETDNLRPFCELLAQQSGYSFDDDDWQAIATMRTRSTSFDYPFAGNAAVHAYFEVQEGADEVTAIRLELDGSDKSLAGRLTLIMDILATYVVRGENE